MAYLIKILILGCGKLTNKKEKEFTGSGSPIYRYEEKEFELKAPEEIDAEAKEQFEDHIVNYLGPISGVYHEIISHLVHIDVYHVEPSESKPYHSLITHGMSDQPMNVPEGCEEWKYSELVCFLPKEWDFSEEGLKNEKYYWVIENMKFLARLPHEYNTWLSYGHTIQNGDPIEPFIPETKLSASLIIPPVMLPEEFSIFKVREDKNINIYNVFPIYTEEMEYKNKHGIDKLLGKFDQYNLMDIYDINRENTCKKKWFTFKK
jgi:hypothetical protein